MAGEHAGHRQRMRERFLQNGLDGFADHEVLELLLFYAIPRQNTNPLAHRLIERFGSLQGVMEASIEELSRIEGMGMNAATLVRLLSHTVRRIEKSRTAKLEVLKNRGDVKRYCAQLLRGLKQEHFYVVCLNAQLQILGNALISRGTLDEVQAYPREVAEAILRYNAHSVVLCHNHPGGERFPSVQDVEMTRELADLCTKLSVVMADHVIVTEKETFSMGEYELLVVQSDRAEGMVHHHVAQPGGELLLRKKLEKLEGLKKAKCKKTSG